MRPRISRSLAIVAGVAALATGLSGALVSPAEAAERPITGTLSKAGYRVVAVSPSGATRSVNAAADGSFRIVPRRSVVTLHLVAGNGRYAGPIVVGGTATRAVTGVKAGTRLGTVRVRSGWASARPGASHVDRTFWARARDHKPVGAMRNGLVRGKRYLSAGVGRDLDADGLIGAFDIDDDGDLRIDNFERSSGGRGFFDSHETRGYTVFSNYPLDIADSINANAGNVDRIATTFPETLALSIWAPQPPATAELDCLGLSYCSTGGTGEAVDYDINWQVPFPAGSDSDADGWGDMVIHQSGDDFALLPHASPDQIHAGDAMIVRMSSDGVAPQVELPGVLNFVFQTSPALRSWSVAGGASGTVDYPVTSATYGTVDNPIPVPRNSGTVTFTLWRPQRAAVSGEGSQRGRLRRHRRAHLLRRDLWRPHRPGQ